ncbi:MAG: IS701 family transposase [Pyrinomonadaceae bacterium]
MQGLFHECKSNVERMVERIPESNYQQLQHFISDSEWDAKAVMSDVAENTNLSLESLAGEKGLILDESGNEKAGEKSVGVARQYIGNVGKVCNSQVGVYAGLSRGDKISLVGAKLYLPREWTTDKKRCKKAGIPKEERKYRTKPELGLAIIKELEGVSSYDWVGGDSIYGNSPELRKSLRELGKAFVMDVGEELQVCLEKPHPFLPKSSGRGRTRSRLVIAQEKISLKKLIGEIQAREWKTIEYREGTKGKLVREAVLKKVWIWKKGTAEIEETEVLISRKLDQTEVKYSLCNESKGELSVEIALCATDAKILDRASISRDQRANRAASISSARVESVAPPHCVDDDVIAFHLGNASRKCGKLAANVVRRCQIDVGKYLEKQAG